MTTDPRSEREIISAASPMGQALMGAAPGAVVSVTGARRNRG
jgi:transcription elongation GreA/GreB family factor